MRVELTILAILVCFATTIQHGDAKPLSKAKTEREVKILNDLITYLSRKEEGDVVKPSDDSKSPENEDMATGGATSGQDDIIDDIKPSMNGDMTPLNDETSVPDSPDVNTPEDGDTNLESDTSVQDNQGKDGENSVENMNDDENTDNSLSSGASRNGEQSNKNDKEGEDNGVGSNAEDMTLLNEKTLLEKFDEIKTYVDSLLILIEDGLENGNVNGIVDVLDFLQQFIGKLFEYSQNLQPQIAQTENAVTEILSKMKNTASNLRQNDDATPLQNADEENESTASDKEGEQLSDDAEGETEGEGKPTVSTGGKEKPAVSTEGEGKPTVSTEGEGKPGDSTAVVSNGEGESVDNQARKRLQTRRNLLKKDELLRLLKKIKELEA